MTRPREAEGRHCPAPKMHGKSHRKRRSKWSSCHRFFSPKMVPKFIPKCEAVYLDGKNHCNWLVVMNKSVRSSVTNLLYLGFFDSLICGQPNLGRWFSSSHDQQGRRTTTDLHRLTNICEFWVTLRGESITSQNYLGENLVINWWALYRQSGQPGQWIYDRKFWPTGEGLSTVHHSKMGKFHW